MNNGHLESSLPMQSISDFIAGYTDADRQRIAFAWNGKHAADFEDANQAFRLQVVAACLASPEAVSPLLLEHLFQADAAWSREAWGAPKHFAKLGSVLLTQGKESVLDAFADNFPRSFDTYAGSHHMQLAPELLSRLILHTEERLAMTTESTQRKPLEAALEFKRMPPAGSPDPGFRGVLILAGLASPFGYLIHSGLTSMPSRYAPPTRRWTTCESACPAFHMKSDG